MVAEKLFLTDWVIEAKLAKKITEPKTGDELNGRIEFSFDNNAAFIWVLEKETYEDGYEGMSKFCAELALVHELLHLKMNWLHPPESMEGLYMDSMEHQNLEKMAKSLMMVKYGLDFKWFMPEHKEGGDSDGLQEEYNK